RDGVQLLAVDAASIAGTGAVLLRQGDFLAVAAEREWDAVRAARDLRVEWRRSASLPGNAALFDRMENGETIDTVVLERGDMNAWTAAPVKSEFKARGPYQAHAPFAPNCALADVRDDSALVLCSTQDVYATRANLATLLGLEAPRVRVQYFEGAGTFGHSCWDDCAQAAALLSQLAAAPVRVQFMRHDEHGWDTYGPAHAGQVRVAADEQGQLLSYEYEGWQHHWSLTETTD